MNNDRYSPARPHRITMALICLHLSAVLYVLIGFGLFALVANLEDAERGDLATLGFVAVFSFGMVVPIEVVAYGLVKRKYWAWVAGLVIFGTYATSCFLPLGGLGLWGLLDPGSREEFGVGNQGTRGPA